MNPWLESLGALGLSGVGIGAGLGAARLPKTWWTLGYFLPLAVVMTLRAATHWPAFASLGLVSALASGSVRYAAMSLAVPMLFVTLLMRMASPRKKALLAAFTFVAVFIYGIAPLAAPALVRGRLEALATTYDGAGVCLQQTNYTCGPAAAVTALGKLGIKADEGELAVLSRTSPVGGAQPENLCAALRKRYEADGLSCEHRSFDSVRELQGNCPALAVTKLAPLIDHWVAVLDVTGDRVVIGDPSKGLRRLTHEEFEKVWRFRGILLRRAIMTR